MDLIEDLRSIMKKRGFSPATMSRFIGCSGKQVERWLSGQSKPTLVYRKLIRAGIKRVKKL